MFNGQIRTWGFGKLGGTAGETELIQAGKWEFVGEWSFSNWERELSVEWDFELLNGERGFGELCELWNLKLLWELWEFLWEFLRNDFVGEYELLLLWDIEFTGELDFCNWE